MRRCIYWLKFVLFYLLGKIRRWVSSSTTSGFGKAPRYSVTQKESLRDLEKEGLAIDASYFNGFDFQGRYLGLGIQRRVQGRCETVFFIRVPQVSQEALVLSIQPSTWTTHDGWKTDPGLVFSMREPMTRWRVSFQGPLVESRSRKRHQVTLDLDWTRSSGIFDADLDMDPGVIASSIASQPWSRDLFRNLRDLHQSHYEVFGELCGTIVVDGAPPEKVRLVSMKDRSYGRHRNWAHFRRYVLHYLASEDGLYLCVHLVSIFKTFQYLLVGCVLDNTGNKVAINKCTPTLDGLGETELPFSRPYTLDCEDVQGKPYIIEIQVQDKVRFLCGEGGSGTLFSAYVTGTVNGIPMAGMSEYEYNSDMYRELLASEVGEGKRSEP